MEDEHFPSYVITLDHLPLRQRVEYLKRRGVSGRNERRRIIESFEEMSKLFVLPKGEREWYYNLNERLKQKARDEDDEQFAQFYRILFKASVLGGIAMSAYTGQLRYIPLGLALGVGVPLATHLSRCFVEWLDDDSQIYDDFG